MPHSCGPESPPSKGDTMDNGSVLCARFLVNLKCSAINCSLEHRQARPGELRPLCRKYFTLRDGCIRGERCPLAHSDGSENPEPDAPGLEHVTDRATNGSAPNGSRKSVSDDVNVQQQVIQTDSRPKSSATSKSNSNQNVGLRSISNNTESARAKAHYLTSLGPEPQFVLRTKKQNSKRARRSKSRSISPPIKDALPQNMLQELLPTPNSHLGEKTNNDVGQLISLAIPSNPTPTGTASQKEIQGHSQLPSDDLKTDLDSAFDHQFLEVSDHLTRAVNKSLPKTPETAIPVCSSALTPPASPKICAISQLDDVQPSDLMSQGEPAAPLAPPSEPTRLLFEWDLIRCFNCWEEGHMMYDCALPRRSFVKREIFRDSEGVINRRWTEIVLLESNRKTAETYGFLKKHQAYLRLWTPRFKEPDIMITPFNHNQSKNRTPSIGFSPPNHSGDQNPELNQIPKISNSSNSNDLLCEGIASVPNGDLIDLEVPGSALPENTPANIPAAPCQTFDVLEDQSAFSLNELMQPEAPVNVTGQPELCPETNSEARRSALDLQRSILREPLAAEACLAHTDDTKYLSSISINLSMGLGSIKDAGEQATEYDDGGMETCKPSGGGVSLNVDELNGTLESKNIHDDQDIADAICDTPCEANGGVQLGAYTEPEDTFNLPLEHEAHNKRCRSSASYARSERSGSSSVQGRRFGRRVPSPLTKRPSTSRPAKRRRVISRAQSERSLVDHGSSLPCIAENDAKENLTARPGVASCTTDIIQDAPERPVKAQSPNSNEELYTKLLAQLRPLAMQANKEKKYAPSATKPKSRTNVKGSVDSDNLTISDDLLNSPLCFEVVYSSFSAYYDFYDRTEQDSRYGRRRTANRKMPDGHTSVFAIAAKPHIAKLPVEMVRDVFNFVFLAPKSKKKGIVYPSNEVVKCKRHRTVRLHELAMPLMLVNKVFNGIAAEYLYKKVEINNFDKVVRFAKTLFENSSLGERVKGVRIRMAEADYFSYYLDGSGISDKDYKKRSERKQRLSKFNATSVLRHIIEKCPNMHRLSVDMPCCTVGVMHAASKAVFPNLRKIRLHEKINQGTVDQLFWDRVNAAYPGLRVFEVQKSKISVEYDDFKGNRISHHTIGLRSGFNNLSSLALYQCPEISTGILGKFLRAEHFPLLSNLEVVNCKLVSASGLAAALHRIPDQLRRLTFEAFMTISGVPEDEELEEPAVHLCTSISQNCPYLEVLVLKTFRCCSLLWDMAYFPYLRGLNIAMPRFHDCSKGWIRTAEDFHKAFNDARIDQRLPKLTRECVFRLFNHALSYDSHPTTLPNKKYGAEFKGKPWKTHDPDYPRFWEYATFRSFPAQLVEGAKGSEKRRHNWHHAILDKNLQPKVI